MNPLAIFTLIIAVIVGFFAVSSGGLGLSSGGGPIATGPSSPEIRNPQPLAREPIFRGFVPAPPPTLAPPPPPAGGPQPTPPAPPPPAGGPPGVSPWRGKVAITSVQRSGDRPDQEYSIIRQQGFSSSAGARSLVVDVTGWRIESRHSSGIIPRVFTIPEIDAAEQDILLPPGGELIVVSGTPSYQRNFRENACVGYLTQTNTFTPSLAGSCPDVKRDRSDLLRQGFNGACIDAIRAVPSCRTPRGPFEVSVIKSECLDYMNKNFSYVGCVENFRDDKNFLKNTWRVYLGRPQKLFDSRHDRVKLRDAQGLLVDEFEY